ncbi:hypothetical protein RHSIM_Rhsim01G0163900 [Rhododendron simsii]|uniref:Uncharacterized protein n=1 Tax=Rhododendron simsii TaxID=118357 RepID=A0A834HJI1_RHOSS|nr:hypothetical protein RHSIM_Rhsim01G0163900 [Rhododendron simsii]
MGDCIIQGFTFKVNSGTSVKFWKHKWLGEESLQSVFPTLYRISAQKEAMIADMVNNQNQDSWKFQFTRRLRDWERDQLQYLGLLLSVVQLQDSSDDCLQWKWRSIGIVLDALLLKDGFEGFEDLISSILLSPRPKRSEADAVVWLVIQDVMLRQLILKDELRPAKGSM